MWQARELAEAIAQTDQLVEMERAILKAPEGVASDHSLDGARSMLSLATELRKLSGDETRFQARMAALAAAFLLLGLASTLVLVIRYGEPMTPAVVAGVGFCVLVTCFSAYAWYRSRRLRDEYANHEAILTRVLAELEWRRQKPVFKSIGKGILDGMLGRQ